MLIRYLYRVFLILNLCIWFIADVGAQWNRFVTNFKKEFYDGGAQTWQVLSYDGNYFYFANKKGLLEYDGSDWKLFQINNQTDIRSVHISQKQNRIYVGGESEFGFFELNQNGQLVYTELSEEFIKEHALSGSFWGIYEVDNIIYYVSDRYIVKQIEEEFTLIPSPFKIDCSTLVNNILYLGTYDGIKLLVGNTLLPLPEGDILKQKNIRSITRYEDGLLIATALDGLFLKKENKIERFITGHEAFIQKNELFSLAVSKDYLAVGTIHKGLLLLSRKDFSAEYYNEDNGLQNNTVLSLGFDNKQNIWLGLDNGIDYITIDSPLTNLYTYPNSKGSGYVSLIVKDKIYLGTNRGLFYSDWPVRFTEKAANMEFLTELSGQVWDLADYNGDLFCMHDKGVYIVKENKIELIPGLRGAISFIPHETDLNKCWISTYDSFYLLEKQGGKWNVIHQIPEIRDWPKNVVFESPEILWVRKLNEGIERISLDTTDYSVKDTRVYTPKDGFTSTTNLYVYNVNKRVYFASDSGFYAYNKETDKIIKATELDAVFSKRTTVLADRGDVLYALSPNGIQCSVMNETGVLSNSRMFSFSRSKVDFIRYYERIDVVNDSLVIIPNEHGFALLNTKGERQATMDDLFIKNVYGTYPKDSLLFQSNHLNLTTFPKLEYTRNAIRIEYGTRSFGQNQTVRFRYRLNPDPVWSDYTQATVKEYNNLKEGDYSFEVEAHYSDGGVNATKFSFTILPPWYRSIYAWIVYFLLFLLCVRLIYLFEERRITRRKKKELAEKEREIFIKEQEFLKEDLRKEQKIVELKNENLEQELKHKSQEMANLMINLSRKNEILIDIKNELYKVLGEMRGEVFVKPKRMIVSLNNQIDSNIQSDDMLKRFEEQFDLVHNKFISKLRKKHPDLSVGEIKMCTYLKMNLTSKEIAPLLNMSVRGVETLRYRLRKKIGLEREDNLMEYLNTLS
ncbi:MAG: transcriptional regulator [Massilibacteroides sp.]|nr:transcriptional regulator [Massilibacteroides sp.]